MFGIVRREGGPRAGTCTQAEGAWENRLWALTAGLICQWQQQHGWAAPGTAPVSCEQHVVVLGSFSTCAWKTNLFKPLAGYAPVQSSWPSR